MPSHSASFTHLTQGNRQLLDLTFQRDRLFWESPEALFPIFLRPCKVRVLLVADGILDFSLGDFGLRTFVEILRTSAPYYVRFEITLAHISDVSLTRLMSDQPGIARRIPSFKFDDTGHFNADMYDQVWLFGIATSYANPDGTSARGNDATGQPYPSTRLADTELRALSEFMDGDGGLFATGDHGFLGRCLSGAVPRARSMRLWGDTSPTILNEVSMTGPRRNDTNRLGTTAGSQFNDQSDDIPQTIAPKMYSRTTAIWKSTFPHPLLCGPKGVIRILPDHPHEGQCVAPTSVDASNTFAGYTITEYPAGAGGTARPLPEVIATSSVLAGTVSDFKDATQPHTFGAISAYDGHRAGVGRVVTDATWHHFVNVNLVGDSTVAATDPKRFGFLVSASGQAHLEDIKAYYRNIAIWISPPASIACMNRRIQWGLIWNHRVIEAVLSHTELRLEDAAPRLILDIGRHARNALGNYAGQCQSARLLLDLLYPIYPRKVIELMDPWLPEPERKVDDIPVKWIDGQALLDMALGGALLAVRESFGEASTDELERMEDQLDEVVARGARFGIARAVDSLRADIEQQDDWIRQLDQGSRTEDKPTKRSPSKRKRAAK